MSNKKRVELTYEWWSAVVEIDSSENTLKLMEEQLLFWSGGKDRITNAGGDIEKAYLKMLAQALIFASMEWNLEGIKSEFDEKEGWCDLRGKFGGVELISCDSWEWDADDFDIEVK